MTNYAMETHGRGSADGPETDESRIASGRPSSGSNYWEAGYISLTAGESRNHRKMGVVFLTSGNTERDGVILLTTGTTEDEQVGERKWRHASDADASFRVIIEIHFIRCTQSKTQWSKICNYRPRVFVCEESRWKGFISLPHPLLGR